MKRKISTDVSSKEKKSKRYEKRSSVRENELHESTLDLWLHLGRFDSTDKHSPGQVGLNDGEDLELGIVFDLGSYEELVDLEQYVVVSYFEN